MECVILAGGLGTRIRPVAAALPKALIPVGGRPFLDRQLDWLAGEGIDRAVLCVGHRGDMIRRHIGDGSAYNLSVTVVDEGDELRGTAGALRHALDCGVLSQQFLVLYGDSWLPISLKPVWESFLVAGSPALMTVLKNEGRWDRSNAMVREGWVALYEKGTTDPRLDHIDYGVSVLSDSVVKEISPEGKVDLADVFHQLSVSGRLRAFAVSERFYEIGSPTGLAELEALFGGMS